MKFLPFFKTNATFQLTSTAGRELLRLDINLIVTEFGVYTSKRNFPSTDLCMINNPRTVIIGDEVIFLMIDKTMEASKT